MTPPTASRGPAVNVPPAGRPLGWDSAHSRPRYIGISPGGPGGGCAADASGGRPRVSRPDNIITQVQPRGSSMPPGKRLAHSTPAAEANPWTARWANHQGGARAGSGGTGRAATPSAGARPRLRRPELGCPEDRSAPVFRVEPPSPQSTPTKPQRKTLVIDLDETLVHSSFDPVQADLRVPVSMDGETYTAHVRTRPHYEQFMRKATQLYDVIVWTASLRVYGDPVVDALEAKSGCGRVRRMFREHCREVSGGFAKDLLSLGVGLDYVAIIDNSPSVAMFQPQNLIPVQSWFGDSGDDELARMIPLLERMAQAQSVYECTGKSASLPWTA
eukprot:TRINITY_DN13227_c3_g2_i1.p1 TRINITY_DN13227_c3_g2~~TRINITY_DN13227_c3_g2_i1.p1  ORF type:complete len:358 (+),score=76.07 TRINITY_DN13227_c3_g2_i1:86-1075(+)